MMESAFGLILKIWSGNSLIYIDGTGNLHDMVKLRRMKEGKGILLTIVEQFIL